MSAPSNYQACDEGMGGAEAMTALLVALVESSDEAIISKDTNGIVLTWNKGAEKLFGYAAAEITGTPITRLIPPDRQEEEMHILTSIRSGASVPHFETVRQTKAGRLIDVSITASPIRDAEGKVIGASKVARDITARKQAENSLRQIHHRLQSVLASMSEGMALLSRDWKLLYVNDQAAAILKRTPGELLTQDFWKLWPHAKSTPFEDGCRQAMASGTSMHFEGFFSAPLNLWLECHCYPSEEGLSVYFRDVTERKRVEEELRLTAQRFELALKGAAVIVSTQDLDLKYTWYFHPELDDAMQWLGKGDTQLFDRAEDAVLTEGLKREAIRTGRSSRQEVQVQWQGEQRVFDLVIEPARDTHGRITGVTCAAIDITERRQAAETLRTSEERFRLAVGAAHAMVYDFNPQTLRLNSIHGVEELAGFAPDEIELSLEWWNSRIEPEDLPGCRAALEALHTCPRDQVLTYRVRHKDGRLMWVEDRVRPLTDAEGNLVRLVGAVVDITGKKHAEDLLRQNAGLFSTLVDQAPTGMYVVDGDFKLSHLNKLAQPVFASVQPAIGTDFGLVIKTLWGEEKGAEIADIFRHTLETGKRYVSQRFAGLRHDLGVEQAYEWETQRVLLPDGQHGVACYFREVTERVRADMTLRRSEAMYRAIGESIDFGVWTCTPEGLNTYISESFLNLTGLTQEQCTAKGWIEVLHPDEVADVVAAWTTTLRTGRSFDMECRVKSVNGTWHHVLSRGVPVKGEDGTIISWAGINLDISALKKAEDERRAGDVRMRLATEATGVGIWEWNVLTHQIWWDPQMFQIYGLPPTADGFVPYATWKNAVLPEDLVQQEMILNATVARRGRSAREFRICKAGKNEIRYLQAVETVRNNALGQAEWVVGTNLDVTERRRTENAIRDEAKRKDEFLAMLGHELRNPLAAIRHAVQAAQESGNDAEACQWAAGVIDRQSQQLARMVDDLLDVARITRGSIQLKTHKVDLLTILDSALSVARPLLEQKGHALTVEIRPGSYILLGDSSRLEQVFVNLLNNAAKYTPSRGIIRVTACAEGGEAVVTVADNGVGISAEILPHVFELFRQEAAASDGTQGGLGIGLTVVKSLVEMHHGSVSLESRGEHLGTAACVRLPLSENPADEAEVAAQPPATPPALARVVRVLVVDDHVDAAQALKRLLTRRGCEVRVVHDGHDGIATAREFLPQVLLIDLGLPGADGYQVASTLRAEQAFHQALFVAISGYAQESDRERTAAAGFDHHYAKPVDFQLLLSAIREKLDV